MATGIRVRHSTTCPSRRGLKCRGKESKCRWEAWVWSQRDQRKIYGSFSSEQAAKDWRNDSFRSVRRGTMRAPTQLTLRTASEQFLADAESGVVLSRRRQPYKPSAIRSYRQDLNKYVLEDFGACRLGAISADDLQELVYRLSGEGLSGSKVRNVIVAVQAVYRRYRKQVAVNPARDLDLPEPGGTREWRGDPEQAKELIAALPEAERALWATAWYAGLRRGELRALRVENIHGLEDDATERWIDVVSGWDDVAGPITPKSKAGFRPTLLPEVLRVELKAQIARTGRSGTDFIFGKTATEPFIPWTIGSHADKAWAKAKLERVTLHLCRHGFRSFLDEAGISEARADRYMGHSSQAVGRRYTHQLRNQLTRDAERLDAYLSGESAKVIELPTGATTGAIDREAASLSG